MLAMAQLLARGESYFPSLADYPYLVANYPPLFVSLTALGERLLGPTLAFPRALALAATLGVVVALFVVLRRLLGSRALAAATALLFVLPWFTTTWAALARVDTLAIALSLAALGVALRHGPTRRAWPALVLAWLAFFTKQNALVAPAAVLLDLLLARDPRFPRVLAAFALPLGALLGLLVAVTGGEAWRHMVPYTAAAPFEPGRMAESYLQLAVIAAPLLATIAAAVVLVPRAFARGEGRVLLLYFALNAAALSTIAKAGAAQNYFLEPWAATILLGGFALRALGERFPAAVSGPAIVLLAAAATATFAYPSLHRLPQALRRPDRAGEFVELTRLVRETRGPVLSENLSLLVVNRRPVLLEPFGILLLAREGVFRPDRLVADCEARRFALVVTEHRMWEIPGFGECLERRYDPLGDLGPYQALRPRP